MKAFDNSCSAEHLDWVPEMLRLNSLPILSPCYCSKCKQPLTASRVMDNQHAWCPHCKEVEGTSCFHVPVWTVGVVVFLLLNNMLLS